MRNRTQPTKRKMESLYVSIRDVFTPNNNHSLILSFHKDFSILMSIFFVYHTSRKCTFHNEKKEHFFIKSAHEFVYEFFKRFSKLTCEPANLKTNWVTLKSSFGYYTMCMLRCNSALMSVSGTSNDETLTNLSIYLIRYESSSSCSNRHLTNCLPDDNESSYCLRSGWNLLQFYHCCDILYIYLGMPLTWCVLFCRVFI